MTRRAPAATATDSGPRLIRRIYGLGSVFGKTLRDSRRATIVVAVVLGADPHRRSASAIVAEFATRRVARGARRTSSTPCRRSSQGLAGQPVNVETLGGYLQYKYGDVLPARGQPLVDPRAVGHARRRGAPRQPRVPRCDRADHAAAHRAREAVRATSSRWPSPWLVIFVGDRDRRQRVRGPAGRRDLASSRRPATRLARPAGARRRAPWPSPSRRSSDAAPRPASPARSCSPGFILNGYQAAIPALAPFANLTWFGWTANHIPLAGQFDWASLGLVAVVAVVLLVDRRRGVRAPRPRRDAAAIPTPRLPRALVGLRGPIGRAISEHLPTALAWGLGLGLFGLVIAAPAQLVHRAARRVAAVRCSCSATRLPGRRHAAGRRLPRSSCSSSSG